MAIGVEQWPIPDVVLGRRQFLPCGETVWQKISTVGIYYEDPFSLPQCDPERSDDDQIAYPCWKLVQDKSKCPGLGQLIDVVRDPSDRKTPLAPGTKLLMQCLTCVDPIPGISPIIGCDF